MAAFVPPCFDRNKRIVDPEFKGLMTTLQEVINEYSSRRENEFVPQYKYAAYAYSDESTENDDCEYSGAASSAIY